jgi:hypothetical protein
MALIDLSSDLAKYRSAVRPETKTTENAASKTTNLKNFGKFQPITEKISQFSPSINKPQKSQLESKVSSTRLDEVVKTLSHRILINSVSSYSPVNTSPDTGGTNRVSLESIISKFGNISNLQSVSRLDRSDVVILRSNSGIFNLTSPTPTPVKSQQTFERTSPDVNKTSQTDNKSLSSPDVFNTREYEGNIQNPNTVINIIPQSFDRPTPNILKADGDASNDVVNPDTIINRRPQSFDRTSQSVIISKDLISPINNITNPDVKLDTNQLIFERVSQSPNIIKDTIQQGLVTNPDTKVFRIDQGSIHLKDQSNLNRDGRPLRFVTTSQLAIRESPREIDDEKYNQQTIQTRDNSQLNVDGNIPKTNPAGRNEDPNRSKFSIIGTQQVNFFQDSNATGFVVRTQKGQTSYQNNSEFTWVGNRTQAPTTNFITDVNGVGFTSFAQEGQTNFDTLSSRFGFEKPSGVDYFDVSNINTTAGFGIFTLPLESKFKDDSSRFTWIGDRQKAPEANFLDVNNTYTQKGFEKFVSLYTTRYKTDSSIYNWDGNRQQAPEANFFDRNNVNTTSGFSKFSQLYDSKLIPESSNYNWDGNRQQAPEVNYFDLSEVNTTSGFSKFAQLYDSKLIGESSNYNWDGNRQQSPEVNYFDLSGTNTTSGFSKFAQLYDSKFIAESSNYNWDGNRQQAPEVNYFDVSGINTTSGFTKFTRILDSKLIAESSNYNWDGNRQEAPQVNYFDLNSSNTTKGFESFVQSNVTRYKTESSRFGWIGNRQTSPEVNFFDIGGEVTTGGFSRLFELYQTKYIAESSRLNWDGNRQAAPSTDFFGNTNSTGFTTFPVKLQSEFSQESSEYSFKGGLPTPVNYFQNINADGFTNRYSETQFKKDTSRFTFVGNKQQAPTTDFFPNDNATGFTKFPTPLATEYKTDVSRFSWIGNRRQSPEVNYFVDTPAKGFSRFALELGTAIEPKASRFTWPGTRQDAPEVDFFKIPNKNPGAIPGFTKLFVDKTQSKLSDTYSSLSFFGTTVRSGVRDVPFTKFFGFLPEERTGFMVGMDNPNLSLYPLLDPILRADASLGTRYATETFRSQNKPQKTTDNPGRVAPKTLGGLPWFDGTIFSSATLVNQVPNLKIRTGAKYDGSSYISKYETTVRDSPNRLGLLTRWATTRRSPSPLDEQYNKYSLQKESVNRETAFFNQPYIVRGIQRDGEVENQRWGFGVTFDDGIVRGGAVTQAERILADVIRLGKWTASIKGVLFNIRQVGLQLMNPVVDINPLKPESGLLGLSATQIFNPITLLANVATARAGLHLSRHGLIPFDSNYLNKYEDATIDRENKSKFISPNYTAFKNLTAPSLIDRQTNYNRLIGLMKELLPNSFQPVLEPSDTGDFATNALVRAGIEVAKKLTGQSGIVRLSSTFGGPQSFFGVGGTQIRRARHPYLTHYTTTPLLMISGEQKEPQYPTTAKRNTYYAAVATYKESFNLINTLKTLVYNLPDGAFELNDEQTKQKTNVKNLQKSTLDRIFTQSPFENLYEPFDNRLGPIDEFTQKGNFSKAKGPNPIHNNVGNPLIQYRTLTYDKLSPSTERRRSRRGLTNTADFNDFRADLELDETTKKFISDPEISNYGERNQEDFYGMGQQGIVGANRDTPFVSTIEYGDAPASNGGPAQYGKYSVPFMKNGQNFRGDRINIIDYKRANFDLSKDLVYELGKYENSSNPGAEDFIEFYFTGLTLSGKGERPAEAIVFRAIFGQIQDNHKPEWEPIKYMGRADPLYVYRGYSREIQFDFTVQITSRDEMKASWRKLNYLASWTAPQYTPAGFMRAPITRLNIGNLYRKMPGFISTLNYSFDNSETTWETAKLKGDQDLSGPNASLSAPGVLQLPKTINVSCTFTPIGVYRPEYGGVMYSLYDDTTGGELENGLVPNSDVKVNYFKTYDTTNAGPSSMLSSDNQRYLPVRNNEETLPLTYQPAEADTVTGGGSGR